MGSINISLVRCTLQSHVPHRNAHNWHLCTAQILCTYKYSTVCEYTDQLDKQSESSESSRCQKRVWLVTVRELFKDEVIFFSSSERLCGGVNSRVERDQGNTVSVVKYRPISCFLLLWFTHIYASTKSSMNIVMSRRKKASWLL